MTEILKKGMLMLMSEKCYNNYLVDFNFFDGEPSKSIKNNVKFSMLIFIILVDCLKALISKGLGIGIIAGSILVKVPQIVKILNNKSAVGLSIFSVLLDLTAITFHMSYSFANGFPFSAWGDGTFLALQTATIGALIFFFEHRSALLAGIFALLYAGVVYVLMSGLTPLELLWTLQGFNVPILLVGKLSQAWANFRNGSTGQLSAVTCFMLFFGSLARIFTSIQETGDTMMIVTFCVSTCANAVIVLQLLYYWNKPVLAIPTKDVPQEKPKSKRAKKAD